MRLVIMLSIFLVSVSTWAGTLKDDFDDGNWQGWTPFGGRFVNAIEAERFSVVEGVLRMDTTVNIMDAAGYEMGLCLTGDWKDYSFSADMRVMEVDPGH